jgi:hypothetical protein
MSRLTEHFGNRFSLNAVGKPTYIIKLKNGQKMHELVEELGKAL